MRYEYTIKQVAEALEMKQSEVLRRFKKYIFKDEYDRGIRKIPLKNVLEYAENFSSMEMRKKEFPCLYGVKNNLDVFEYFAMKEKEAI
jgi:hypothetical protein